MLGLDRWLLLVAAGVLASSPPALAQLLACPLVTLDARLRRGAGHLVEIIGPAELP